ncbi:MAG: wax ester/triacylglycerol synthase family O-acyltransferase [Acidimicrobiia bacterium]|nr:wax ester/triacylglycerol synthase family O-acyltransferase [Acidimicrobiia bacterium]
MAYERLGAQDSLFLHIEKPQQPQHVGSLGILEGGPFHDEDGRFRIDDVRQVIGSRLHLVPRFRKRVMEVPLEQGRPVWVDDEAFDLGYHVRLTALPKPGSEEQLLALFARIQSHLLDRRRPLWELWFVEGLADDRVAVIQKTHHCMVDGISGVDVATVIFDLGPEVTRLDPQPWRPSPPPSPAQLMLESLVERAVEPAEIARSLRSALRVPRQLAERAKDVAQAVATAAPSAPATPWNVPISPHRRWLPLRVPIAEAKAIKDAASADERLGGRVSLNDVVLAAVTTGLRLFLDERDQPLPDDLVLKAMVPVTMRAQEDRDAAAAAGTAAVGNRVSMMSAPLPVGLADPIERLRSICDGMRELKESGAAVGADLLMQMTNYAPPTVLSMASRLLVRSRAINLTITNVPGPQFPLYCLGARVLEAFPYVGIVDGQALTIAVLSYDGVLGFGITGDRDVLPDLSVLTDGIQAGLTELTAALGVGAGSGPGSGDRAAPPGKKAPTKKKARPAAKAAKAAKGVGA